MNNTAHLASDHSDYLTVCHCGINRNHTTEEGNIYAATGIAPYDPKMAGIN